LLCFPGLPVHRICLPLNICGMSLIGASVDVLMSPKIFSNFEWHCRRNGRTSHKTPFGALSLQCVVVVRHWFRHRVVPHAIDHLVTSGHVTLVSYTCLFEKWLSLKQASLIFRYLVINK
jgi:hypothetical protein